MAHPAATETLIEHELDRIDNNSLRDLAMIGLDKVKQGGIAQASPVDDKTIDALKRTICLTPGRIVQKYSTPIAKMIDDQMSQENRFEAGSPAYQTRKQVLVRDMFSRALG